MYKNYKVVSPCKLVLEDVFTGQKETVEFIYGQIVEGRVDLVGSKTMLTLSSGLGGIISSEAFAEI
jgi:hypothetical protein